MRPGSVDAVIVHLIISVIGEASVNESRAF